MEILNNRFLYRMFRDAFLIQIIDPSTIPGPILACAFEMATPCVEIV